MHLIIFGYPKSGKTTLFNLLSGAQVQVEAFREAKEEVHQRSLPIPDERLDRLMALYPDKKKVPATLELFDLPGVAFGDIKAGITLATLRRGEALLHVVRGFETPQIPHPRGQVDPMRDISFMEEELLLSDLAMIENRQLKIDKELKRGGQEALPAEKEVLSKLHTALNEGTPIREIELTPQEEKLIRSFAFLSQKPLLHVVNVDEERLRNKEAWFKPAALKTPTLIFAGLIETEIAELEPEERKTFLEEYGCGEGCRAAFFSLLPRFLNLIFFFTVGKEEVRAWPLPPHTPAQRAAGQIHSDMEKGFIRAEVISYETLLNFGSLQSAREKGAVRLEGKDYLIQDGDVVTFRFAS